MKIVKVVLLEDSDFGWDNPPDTPGICWPSATLKWEFVQIVADCDFIVRPRQLPALTLERNKILRTRKVLTFWQNQDNLNKEIKQL